jgi:hypothetical protein
MACRLTGVMAARKGPHTRSRLADCARARPREAAAGDRGQPPRVVPTPGRRARRPGRARRRARCRCRRSVRHHRVPVRPSRRRARAPRRRDGARPARDETSRTTSPTRAPARFRAPPAGSWFSPAAARSATSWSTRGAGRRDLRHGRRRGVAPAGDRACTDARRMPARPRARLLARPSSTQPARASRCIAGPASSRSASAGRGGCIRALDRRRARPRSWRRSASGTSTRSLR